MRRFLNVMVVLLAAGAAFAQQPAGDQASYATSENPFQGDYEFVAGKPITLHVQIEGVRIDAITLTPIGEVKPGQDVKCEMQVTGSNAGDKKAQISVILLLEDDAGKGSERVTLDPFKVKSGKVFDRKDTLKVAGQDLQGASKVYVFVQISF